MAILVGDVKAAVECTVRMCKEFMERRADRWREELKIGCSELQGIICVCIWGDATNQIEWVEEQRKALREFAYEKYSENKPVGCDEGRPVKGDTAKDGGKRCEKCKGLGEYRVWNTMYPQGFGFRTCNDCGGTGHVR